VIGNRLTRCDRGETLERFFDFLDRLFGLPYWQMALLAVLVVGMAVGGYFILRPSARPVAEFQAAEEEAGESGKEGQLQLTVHVSGAVKYPGVVLLEKDDRVMDAIEAAGGPLPEADLEKLNLAQIVQDGQKIAVPVKGESGTQSDPGQGEEKGKVNLNTADQKGLEELPGIGPTLAERIIAYREKKGGFRSVDELKQVSGIGEKKFAEIRDMIEI
jgi:competence protein ComEA